METDHIASSPSSAALPQAPSNPLLIPTAPPRPLVNDQGMRRCLRTDSRRKPTGSVPKKVTFQITGPCSGKVVPEGSKPIRITNRKPGLLMSFFSACQSFHPCLVVEPHKRSQQRIAVA